jgi:GNAT superfamily N-acetyltransferase
MEGAATRSVSDLELELSTSVAMATSGPPGLDRWTAEATEAREGHGSAGRLQVLAVDLLRCPDPWAALDSSNDTIAYIGDVLFDANTGQLAEGVASRLGSRSERILLLDRVELEPEWQGRSVAALLVALTLERLRPGCRAAVCLPGPLETMGMSERDYRQGVERMKSVWQKVGFAPLTEGLWALDLTSHTLDDRLSQLRAVHGLA